MKLPCWVEAIGGGKRNDVGGELAAGGEVDDGVAGEEAAGVVVAAGLGGGEALAAGAGFGEGALGGPATGRLVAGRGIAVAVHPQELPAEVHGQLDRKQRGALLELGDVLA